MPVPPRTARGFVSGEWLIENKIATTRIRVIAIDDQLEVRLEDLERYGAFAPRLDQVLDDLINLLFTQKTPTASFLFYFDFYQPLYNAISLSLYLTYIIPYHIVLCSGEIFGACPVPRGQRDAAVENAVDSSRNFVLRIVDPATNRHAFLGVNFSERSNAFDFNVAITDFEKRVQREDELKRAAEAAASGSGASSLPSSSTSKPSSEISPEAAVLYQKNDFTLKEGEHFKVEVKKSTTSPATGGFLSRLGAVSSSTSGGGNSIGKLAPPLIPGPPPSSADPFNAAAFQHTEATTPAALDGTTTTATEPVEAAKVVASSEEGWATF